MALGVPLAVASPARARSESLVSLPAETNERRKLYRISAVTDPVADVRKVWAQGPLLDQGSTPYCTGYAWVGAITAAPYSADWSKKKARRYAKNLVLKANGGLVDQPAMISDAAQVLVNRGVIDAYAWAATIDDVRRAVIDVGPVVIGVEFMPSMFYVTKHGRVKVNRTQVGFGHAMLVTGYIPGNSGSEPLFRLRNSMGRDWGRPDPRTNLGDGNGWITASDLSWLLFENENFPGSACLPVGGAPFKE